MQVCAGAACRDVGQTTELSRRGKDRSRTRARGRCLLRPEFVKMIVKAVLAGTCKQSAEKLNRFLPPVAMVRLVLTGEQSGGAAFGRSTDLATAAEPPMELKA